MQVKILTGDNDIVTRKICHEVGLPVDRIVLGSEMATLSPDELASLAETAAVFAKVSPSQKAAIIDALHRKGHVVGFLGDGINDGPALKAADVGISVDSAVDIAKDSADIILLEKSLAVLGEGVIEGRKVFGNITKYIKMGASSNFGNMFSVLGASIILPFLPMTAIQVLTNNLLYDFSQTTIPTDNVDAEYLAVPRRWDIGNITKFVLFIGPISSIFDYVTYFTMLYVFNAWNNPALFQTGWFVESLLTQTLIIHIIRTAKIPFLESRASTALITTTIIIAAIGIALPFTWLGGFLGFVPLPPAYWICARPDPPELCHPDAFREDMVHSTVRVELNGGSPEPLSHCYRMSSFGLALPSALLNLLFFQVLIWQFSALANYGWRSRRQVVTAMQSDCLLCAKIPTSPWPRSSGAMLRSTCSSRCCRIPSLPA